MAFDFAQLDTLTRSELGVPMEIINPRTGAPFRDADSGNQITITLKGKNSDAYREKQRQLQERRRDRQARGIKPDQKTLDADDVELLAALTTDWTFDKVDGQPFPPTPANIAAFWADWRWVWVRDLAIAFVLGDHNFLAT